MDSRACLGSCLGCGAEFPLLDGPTHRYMLSSPACWAAYGEVLAREYSSVEYFRVHRLTVDAYAVQHPGVDTPVSRQSVGLHLLGLHSCLEAGLDPAQATGVIRRATERIRFTWLEVGGEQPAVTVREVLATTDVSDHTNAVERWANAAWQQFSVHHELVREWANQLY